MKKTLLAVVMLCLSVAGFAQEAPAWQEQAAKMLDYAMAVREGRAAFSEQEAAKACGALTLKDGGFVDAENHNMLVGALYFLKHHAQLVAGNLEKEGAVFNMFYDNKATYDRFAWVLREGSDALKEDYLQNIGGVLEQNDLTEGAVALKPLIGEMFPEGQVKEQIMATYMAHERTAPGMKTPDFSLEDYKHNMHHLTDYAGRILVIDFWATWCGVCIENLPSYAELASQYEGDGRVAFITISIDSRAAFKKWMYSLARLNLLKLTNLIAPADGSDFSTVFNVRGVPRYVIIGADGNIITAKAPTPHDGLKEMVDAAIAGMGKQK